MGVTDRITQTLGLLSTMVRAGIIAPMRPDKYLRIVDALIAANRIGADVLLLNTSFAGPAPRRRTAARG